MALPGYNLSPEFLANEAKGHRLGPIRKGSPEDETGAAVIDRLIVASPEASFIPRAWLGMLTGNPDKVLATEGGDLTAFDDLLDDDVAMSNLQQRRLAITSRDWEVAPGDPEDPRSVKAADDLRAMLKGLGWDRVTGLMHFAIWYGYGVAEAMWTTRMHEGRRIVWLEDIVVPDRRWFGFTVEGELRLTSTYLGIDGEALPPNKFWTVRTGATHDFAFYGLGLAHWCYWPIFFKRAGIKFWALYLEKYGRPTVGIEYQDGDSAEQKASRLAAAMAVGNDSAVLLPPGSIKEDLVKIYEASRSGGAGSYKDFVTEQNEALMRVVLGQPGTSKATPQGVGSGQSDVHKDVRDEIVKADSDIISESFGQTFGAWVTRWNHGEDVAPPTVYRVLDDAEDVNTTATRDATLDAIGIKRTEESVREIYGDGYELDRLSEEDKAAQAAALVQAKNAPRAVNDDAPEDRTPSPEAMAFSAGESDAIDRVVARLLEDTSPVFAAMGDVFSAALEGITSAEGARVALLEAFEKLPIERLARETALPMLATRATADVGAENAQGA